MHFQRSDFPEGFLFGVATSSYQIEGHAFGGAGPTHWDSFAATPGNVVRAEHGQRACDHYHRWEEDLDLIRHPDQPPIQELWDTDLTVGRSTGPCPAA
jgi:beta-glucosidase